MHPLTIARVCLALAATVEAAATRDVLHALTRPDILHLPISGLPYPSMEWADALVLAWILGAAMMAGGSQAGAGVLSLSIGYVLLLDQQTYSNHLYLMAMIAALLSLPATQRSVQILALKSQLTLVYFFAAVSKLNAAFLSGIVIAGSLRPIFDWMRTPLVLVPLALSAIAIELYLSDSLWVPSRRKIAAVLGVALHVGFVVMMDNTRALATFGLACVSLYPLFWLPETEQVQIHAASHVADVGGHAAIR